jgi:hypothetical protein
LLERERRQAESRFLQQSGRYPAKQEARRVLSPMWNRVERWWEQAEAATRAVEQARRQGHDARGATHRERLAWEKASQAFQQYEQGEAGWKRAEPAFNVFRPDGQLNDRSWAQEQVPLVLPQREAERPLLV